MSSLNSVQLIGRLTRDPDVRKTTESKPITNVSIATSEQWKDQSGQKQERSEFTNVVFFGPVADIAANYLSKGSQCFVQGKLQTRKWTDQNNVERYSTEVIVDRGGKLVLLGGKQQNNASKPTNGDVVVKEGGKFNGENVTAGYDTDCPF